MPRRHQPPQPLAAPVDAGARQERVPRAGGYIVRASELGRFAYCRRAWWFRYVEHREPPDAVRGRLDAGNVQHAAHGRSVWLAGVLWKLGLACAALAALSAIFWLIAALVVR